MIIAVGLIVIGLTLLLQSIGIIGSVWGFIWPSLLILMGIQILRQKDRSACYCRVPVHQDIFKEKNA